MSWRFLLRLLLVLAVLAGGVMAGTYFLRPVALVTPVRRDTARDAVAGTLTVQAVPFPLVADVGGRIAESHLELGRTVTMGEVVVKLDDSSVKLEIEDLNSQIKALQDQMRIGSATDFALKNAEVQLATAEANFADGSISTQQLEGAKREVARIQQALDLEHVQRQQSLESLQNRLKSRELTLAKMTLKAGTDGTVTRINAYTDYLVNPGTVIAEIVSAKRTVEAKISEDSVEKVRVGQAAIVRLSGYGDQPFPGTVSLTLPAADTETQRYLVHLDVDIENEKLLPGMTGDVLIVVNERPNALLIPRAALNGGYVYVVADGRAVRRKVEVGFQDLNEAEILSGLAENDVVIVDELERFDDGMAVRTREETETPE